MNFDKNQLRPTVLALQPWKREVFLLSICERLWPHFLEFAKDVKYEAGGVFEIVLKKSWELLEWGETQHDLSAEAERCLSALPDSEDYRLPPGAQEAAISLTYLAQVFTENDWGKIFLVTQLAYEWAFSVAEETLFPAPSPNHVRGLSKAELDKETKICHEHPVVQAELTRQREDLEYLASLPDDPKTIVPELRKKWSNPKTSNIGLTIE